VALPLCFQGASGCEKTEAVRHFSANRDFNSRTPIFSVVYSVEASVEQFVGSQVFEKGGFRFVEGPLVEAVRE
jgi:MoxR-like ATPase